MYINTRIVGNEEFNTLCKASLDSVLCCDKSYDALVFQYLKKRITELDDKTIYEMYSDMSDANEKSFGMVQPRKQINGWWEFYQELQKEKKRRDKQISIDSIAVVDFNEIAGCTEYDEYDE